MVKTQLILWGPIFLWAGLIFTVSSIPTLPEVGFIWWDFALKKSAHMFEYAVLFLLLRRAQLSVKQSFLIAILYAISDEIHQRFVPGRTSKLTDVGFDTMGMLIAYALRKPQS